MSADDDGAVVGPEEHQRLDDEVVLHDIQQERGRQLDELTNILSRLRDLAQQERLILARLTGRQR